MATITVEMNEPSYHKLKLLAEASGKPLHEVLDQAIEALQRKQFLEGVNADFARLRANPELWQEELEERRLWEATLMDGLEDE